MSYRELVDAEAGEHRPMTDDETTILSEILSKLSLTPDDFAADVKAARESISVARQLEDPKYDLDRLQKQMGKEMQQKIMDAYQLARKLEGEREVARITVNGRMELNRTHVQLKQRNPRLFADADEFLQGNKSNATA